jgi:hypothetical protein
MGLALFKRTPALVTLRDVEKSLDYLPMSAEERERMRENLRQGIGDEKDVEAYARAVDKLELRQEWRL